MFPKIVTIEGLTNTTPWSDELGFSVGGKYYA